MERIISRIGGLIVSPKETMKLLVHEGRGLSEAALVVLAFSLSYWASVVLALRHLVRYVAGPLIELLAPIAGIARGLAVLGVALGVALTMVAWVALSAASHLLIRALGGGGSFEDTMSVLGYSHACLAIPLAPLAISPLTPLVSLAAHLVLGLAAAVWFVYLAGVGLSESHGVGLGRAMAAVAVPALAAAALLLVLPLSMAAISALMG